MQPTDALFSVYRLHSAHKTGIGGEARNREILDVVSRYSTEDWLQVYRSVHNIILPRLRIARKLIGIPHGTSDTKVPARWLKYLVSPRSVLRHGRRRIRTALEMLSW